MASADYKVIDNLLIPEYANWNVRFASNQIVLCYTGKSAYAKEINADNWDDILLKKDVSWGHTDPNIDPCGYRALMVLQLAEKHLNKPGLMDKLIANRSVENVFPKASQMVSVLQSGNLDYCWEYLSVAVQHGLKYIVLPDEINLGNYKYNSNYKQAVVKVTGKTPGSFMELKGKSITYGVTMLKNSPNKEGAIAFLGCLFSRTGGLMVLEGMGQPPFIPCRVPTAEMKSLLPAKLQKMVEIKP
jgi:molybdate/tungstate transport system substrate-binding protein